MVAHTVRTVGHSARSAEEFAELLRAFCVQEPVDVRTVPRSRTAPRRDRDQRPDSRTTAGTGHARRKGPVGRRPATPRDADGDPITHPGGEPCST